MKKSRAMADFGHKGETQFMRKSPPDTNPSFVQQLYRRAGTSRLNPAETCSLSALYCGSSGTGKPIGVSDGILLLLGAGIA
jgi:hypothetical protein